MLKKRYSKDRKSCAVTFTVRAEQAAGAAKAVLLGDFNNWDKTAGLMKKTPEGGFETSLKLETGREYHFRYLFDDNRWDNDWNADKYCPNPYGGEDNGVIIV